MSASATESTAVKRKRRKREEVSSFENEGNVLNNLPPVKRKVETTQREEETMLFNQTVGNMSSFNPTLSSSTPIVSHKKKKKSDGAQHGSEVNFNKVSSVLDNLVDGTEDDPIVRDIEDKIRSQNQTETDTPQDPKELLASLFSHSKQVEMKCKLKFKRKDIHILSIPKCIDPMSLLGVKIKLDAPSKFKLDQQKYLFEPTEVTPPPSLMVGSNCKIIKPKSSIFIKKYIKPAKLPQLPLPEKKAVPLPDNLKKRHPLFGADFEQKINLSEDVERKLNNAIESFMRREEKLERKKLKKKKKQEALKSEQPNEVIFDLLNAHQTRNSSDKEDSAYSSTGSKSVKGVDIKQELFTEYETDYEGALKKKKKRRKITNDDDKEGNEKKKKGVESDETNQHVTNKILKNIKKEISLDVPSTSEAMNKHDNDRLGKHKKSKKHI